MISLDVTEFQNDYGKICETPNDYVQSPVFKKALYKTLKVENVVNFIQGIVTKRLSNVPLSQGDITYLNTLETNDNMLEQWDTIIKTIEHANKKKSMHGIRTMTAKNLIAWLKGENIQQEAKETQEEFFCGIALGELTVNQKILFDKVIPSLRKRLSQKIYINKAKGQIEFPKLNLAIKDTDIAQNVTKQGADKIMNTLNDGWILPRDVDYINDTQFVFDPKKSDYDAMAFQLPGRTYDDRIENFRLLTGMLGKYYTGQSYKKSEEVVFRGFFEDDWSRNSYDDGTGGHVRPVKHIVSVH